MLPTRSRRHRRTVRLRQIQPAYLVAGAEPALGGVMLLDGKPIDNRRDRGMVSSPIPSFPWHERGATTSRSDEDSGKTRGDKGRSFDRYLAEVGLEGFADAYPKQLSGG